MNLKLFALLMLLGAAMSGLVAAHNECEDPMNNTFEDLCQKCCQEKGYSYEKSFLMSDDGWGQARSFTCYCQGKDKTSKKFWGRN